MSSLVTRPVTSQLTSHDDRMISDARRSTVVAWPGETESREMMYLMCKYVYQLPHGTELQLARDRQVYAMLCALAVRCTIPVTVPLYPTLCIFRAPRPGASAALEFRSVPISVPIGHVSLPVSTTADLGLGRGQWHARWLSLDRPLA